ncbi:DUF4276 family protein [Dokdonella fugitiva]|uniref:DUF4276 family protein n=1 Tax=Dokdonella fugitiva TaxID=328517 RepID=UPI00104A643F
MTELVILTEEPSAGDLLDGLLPRLLPEGWTFRCFPYEGKQDLEKRAPTLVRAWQNPDAAFVVLRDQDSGDCRDVKARLVARFDDPHKRPILFRIACRELEAWIVGDLHAFAEEFSVPTAAKAMAKAKFRNPDTLGSCYLELGRFVPGYQKRDGARRMGRLLDPQRNASPSFQAFCDGVRKISS